MRSRFLAVLPLCLAVFTTSAQHIRDPKASLVDIPAQQTRLRADPGIAKALGRHSCLKLPDIPASAGRMQIPHHYLTGSNGAVNPAEADATKPYNALENRVGSGAQQWLASGSEAEAQCALAQLDTWAQARALLDYDPKESSQAWFQVEWTLAALGVSNSVLVNDTKLDPAAQARVNAWLKETAHRLLSFDKPNGNNHHYWRGLAATSIGVSTNDDSLFKLGVQIYKDGIEEIDTRGAFPQEMARHENAIHYQSFALQPLLLIAQFASRQGVDLYTYAAHGRTLREAIVFLGNAAADPTLLKPYTTEEQKGGLTAGDFTAEAFFVARFGANGLPSNIAASLTHHAWQSRLGGDTLLFLPPATNH